MMLHLHVIVIFAAVFAVVHQVLARPRRFYIDEKEENSLVRVFKSISSPNELFCPRNIEGLDILIDKNKTISGCSIEYNLCDDDYDCEPGLKCCPSGCIYKCTVPEKLRTAVAIDWVREPEALTVGGNAWLIKGDGTGSSPRIDCTTSEIPGMEPRKCPSGFICKIQEDGDESQQIPNRGICMRSQTEDSDDLTQLLASDPLPLGSGCLMNGKEILHGHLEVLDCKICFCKDGEVFCRFFPCFDKKTL